MLNKENYYKYLFLIGAVWNVILGLAFILTSIFMLETGFDLFGVIVPSSLMFYHLFFGAVIIFGVGYYLVSVDLDKNHGVVIIGVIAKIWVFVITGYYFFIGDINILGVAPAVGDLIFAILFIEFLVNYER
ncbi:MAG: hypothetical protein ACFFD4_00305 [Candidatus Odinarchaeota archaeon]